MLFRFAKKRQDKSCKTVLTQTDATAAYSTTKGPFYDVRNLPLEVVSEDSHLMPLIIYQVCFFSFLQIQTKVFFDLTKKCLICIFHKTLH